MRTLTIEFGPGVDGGMDVVDEYGRRCNGLCFGEALEQIVGLVHPQLGAARYQMLTPDEWQAFADERAQARRLRALLSST